MLCYIVWFDGQYRQAIDIISWLFPILATAILLFQYANKANTCCLCYFIAKYESRVRKLILLQSEKLSSQENEHERLTTYLVYVALFAFQEKYNGS